jgi:hypothetical protein
MNYNLNYMKMNNLYKVKFLQTLDDLDGKLVGKWSHTKIFTSILRRFGFVLVMAIISALIWTPRYSCPWDWKSPTMVKRERLLNYHQSVLDLYSNVLLCRYFYSTAKNSSLQRTKPLPWSLNEFSWKLGL